MTTSIVLTPAFTGYRVASVARMTVTTTGLTWLIRVIAFTVKSITIDT